LNPRDTRENAPARSGADFDFVFLLSVIGDRWAKSATYLYHQPDPQPAKFLKAVQNALGASTI
jgi:hypothetical protein